MVSATDHNNLKTLIVETVTLLCKNGLQFQSEFCVEGLLGITLDRGEVFLVNIKETVRNALEQAAAAAAGDEGTQPSGAAGGDSDRALSDAERAHSDRHMSRANARKRRRRRHMAAQRHAASHSDESDNEADDAGGSRGGKRSRLDAPLIKEEKDDVIVIKEEQTGDDLAAAGGDLSYGETGVRYSRAGDASASTAQYDPSGAAADPAMYGYGDPNDPNFTGSWDNSFAESGDMAGGAAGAEGFGDDSAQFGSQPAQIAYPSRKKKLECQNDPLTGMLLCPFTECGLTFNRYRTLYRHYKITHLKLRKPCPICGKLFAEKLNRHIKYVHKEYFG